jgi:long-subunit fatty acid transport protein
VPITSGVNQAYDAHTTGSYDELAFGWGGNMEDKLYLGASIVLPMINYSKRLTYSEVDATSNPDNNFASFVLDENFSSRGWGLGAKFGIIYKPEPFLRLGFTLHTPQVISFRDQMSTSLSTNTEKYAGMQSVSSSELNNGYAGTREYTVSTPTKAIFSTSYFFASPSKPSQPLGFIAADLEVVNYAGTRFYSNTFDKATSDYYSLINSVIKDAYRNNINFKLGSEIKLSNNWMIRGGAAYYGSPYKDETLKASRMILSGGIGYRTNRNFIDFTIVSSSTKDAVFPYRLNDKPNTYASLTANQLVFNIGYGIRF